jgi:hypothetical protein
MPPRRGVAAIEPAKPRKPADGPAALPPPQPPHLPGINDMPNLPRPPSDLEQRPGLFRRRSTENNTTDGSWHSADCTRDSEEWPTAEIARPSSSAIQTAAGAASSSTVLPQNSATGRASTAGAASPRGVANPTVEAAARLLSEMQDGGDPSQAGRAVKERAKGGKGFFGGKAKEAATSKRGGQRSGTEEGEALLGQPDNGQEDAGRRGRKGLWRRAEKKKTETAWEILHRLQKEEAKVSARQIALMSLPVCHVRTPLRARAPVELTRSCAPVPDPSGRIDP